MNPEIQQILDELRDDMTSYMEDGDGSYTKADINACFTILSSYLDSISKSNSKEEGIQIVKRTVFALNDLNEKCEIIETMERDMICEVILIASSDKGYTSRDEDITEEWREW